MLFQAATGLTSRVNRPDRRSVRACPGICRDNIRHNGAAGRTRRAHVWAVNGLMPLCWGPHVQAPRTCRQLRTSASLWLAGAGCDFPISHQMVSNTLCSHTEKTGPHCLLINKASFLQEATCRQPLSVITLRTSASTSIDAPGHKFALYYIAHTSALVSGTGGESLQDKTLHLCLIQHGPGQG